MIFSVLLNFDGHCYCSPRLTQGGATPLTPQASGCLYTNASFMQNEYKFFIYATHRFIFYASIHA